MAEEQQQSEQAAEAEGVSLIDQIMQETRLKPADEGYETAKKGIQAFIGDLLAPQRRGEKVEQKVVDNMIAEIDNRVSRQVDEIIHHESFQKLESSWRGLKMVVDRTDFRENIRMELLSVSKDDLLEDFEDAPDITKSGLYKHVYSAEFGQFGGQPYGALISDYQFGPGAQDIKLLGQVAGISAMSHAPFIAGAGAEFSGLDSFDGMPNLTDWESIFEGPQYAQWQAFRESDLALIHISEPKRPY